MTTLLSSLSSVMATWGPSLVVKATVTLVLTLLVVRLARQSSAAVRHLWLTAGFAVLLALPFAPALVPAVRVEVMPVVVEEYIAEPLAIEAIPVESPAPSQRAAVPHVAQGTPTRAEILVLLWLGGLLACGLPVAIGLVQVRRFRRRGLPWLDGQRVVSALASEADLRRPVDVALHESIDAPATCGIRRHAILFPIEARGWSAEDIARAAVHELEHVRRADCLINVFARLVCAAYWFHPLAWVAWRRLSLEAERACDDAVLRRAEATTYADQLVTLAGRLTANTRHPLLAMANRNDLVQRVAAVLDQRQARGRVGVALGAVIMLAAFTAALAISPLQAASRVRDVTASALAPSVSADTRPADVAPATIPPLDELRARVNAPLSAQQIASPSPPAASQTSQSMRPAFEVVSIRRCPNASGRGGGPSRFTPESAFWDCQTLEGFMQVAYVMSANGSVLDTPISGPSWIRDERYTISAKAAGITDLALMRGPMLQALLEDRFKLKIRRESRDVPVMLLTVARDGHRLKPFVEGSCTPRPPDFRPGDPPWLKDGETPCRTFGTRRGRNKVVEGQGITLDIFAALLRDPFGRVINKTGLEGRFDINVMWDAPTGPLADAALSSEPSAPSVFAVLDELGLKLEEGRDRGESLVIESVERPSEN